MTQTAFLFPGQGSQAIGMARDVYEADADARQVIDTADAMIPGLRQIMFEGPEEDLRRTKYTQPALLTASIALLTVFCKRCATPPACVAGHSLGEYSALVAANVLSFEQALTLVKKRAELMDNAPAGSMAAIVGLSLEDVQTIIESAKAAGILVMANHNSPEQVVISGEVTAIDKACELAVEKVGPRRAIKLPVSGAFHSPLMQAACDELASLIAATDFQEPTCPVITNVDGQATSSASVLKEKLSRQMISSVYWVDTMQSLETLGVSMVLEIGSGKVLTGLYRKYSKEGQVFNVSDMGALEVCLTQLAEETPVTC